MSDELKAFIEAVRKANELLCFEDQVYDIRSQEGKGWEGPQVTEYASAVTTINQFLKANPCPNS